MFEKVLSKNAKESLGLLGKTSILKNERFQEVNIADLRDIAAMKIAAISDRGTKRDFVDLYFFIKSKIATLEECLDLYDRKFRALRQNKIHIIKSLSYFADADEEKMPKLFQSISWKEIKRFLEREVRYLSRRLLL